MMRITILQSGSHHVLVGGASLVFRSFAIHSTLTRRLLHPLLQQPAGRALALASQRTSRLLLAAPFDGGGRSRGRGRYGVSFPKKEGRQIWGSKISRKCEFPPQNKMLSPLSPAPLHPSPHLHRKDY